jgi:GPH family glycoside/pentoside/hexuronide:cation symporter
MLPLRTRILYGSSRLGAEALNKGQAILLLYYYAPPDDQTIGLPTLLPWFTVATLLTVGGILGSLDDALVGWLSDRTRSRWGRRIPYIVLGAPLWSVFFVLLFVPPASAGHAASAVYLFVVFQLVRLCSAIVVGPYEALTPEMAPTSEERVGLQAVKVYLGVAGSGVGLIGGSLVLAGHVSFQAMAVTFAGLALVCQYLAVAGVWNRAKQSHITAEIGFREGLGIAFANRSFRILLPTIVLFALAVGVLIANTGYYIHALVGKHSWVNLAMLPVAFVSALAFVPVFMRLARRTSKRRAYSISMLAAAVTFPLLTFAGVIPGIPASVQIVVAGALVGAPLGAHFLFPIPLISDVIDDDSTQTRQRREATYLGAASFVEGVATSFAFLLVSLLGRAGHVQGHTLGVRLDGVVGGALILAAYLVFRRYDLADEVVGRVPPEAVLPPEAEPVPV